MTDKTHDPVAMWQKMVGEMEKGFNSFANQAMASPEFSQAVNRAGGVAAGAQKQLGELMEKYLVTMNLPSREQVTGLAERLQSVEAQIGEIKCSAGWRRVPGARKAWTLPRGRRGRSARPPNESRRERAGGTRFRIHPGAHPERGPARDSAQHQGR